MQEKHTMKLSTDEIALINALRDPEKCAEIISVLMPDDSCRKILLSIQSR